MERPLEHVLEHALEHGRPAHAPMASNDDQCLPAEPPCRAAARYVTKCPVCARKVTIKTPRYSHVCGRSFDKRARAAEQQAAAHVAVRSRTRPVAQARAVQEQAVQVQEQAVVPEQAVVQEQAVAHAQSVQVQEQAVVPEQAVVQEQAVAHAQSVVQVQPVLTYADEQRRGWKNLALSTHA
jgi:hypothetical protein